MKRERLLTTVVGSYPQPDWLIDRENLKGRPPPRVRAREIWRVEQKFLEQAQDDTTLLAIREMESADIDIVSDGEIRRESYSNRFATALDGIDIENPGVAVGRTGRPSPVPRVVGPVRWKGPILLHDAMFLRQNTNRRTKIQEAKALKSTGVDVIQIDEPYLQAMPEKAKEYAVEVINRALEEVEGPTALHSCFGYAHMVKNKPNGYSFLTELDECTMEQLSIEAAQPNLDLSVLESIHDKTIILGVINLEDNRVETPEMVGTRIRKALKFIAPERLIVAPDCGMKYLDRNVAFGKLKSLAEGARIIRAELH